MASTLDLTRDLRDLGALQLEDESVELLLRRGLDMLARVAPYDLATVFDVHDGQLIVRATRGKLATEEVRRMTLALEDFPSIAEALELRRARAFLEEDHVHGDGDPFDDVLGLPPGHSCMVVPLFAGDRCFGVLTLDRKECVPYSNEAVNLVEVYGQMLAIALRNARDKIALGRLHQQDHEHAKLLEAELAGDPLPLLEAESGAAMKAVVRQAKQVALTNTPVLIMGETGTGKERLARAIHQWSARAEQPFVAINCAAVPSGLLESELFGHTKGAFTGATKDRSGRFQMANGGTLLLDEIGELPPELQSKLLRVLQEGEFEPVGSDRTVKVDVRILAATNVDLPAAIKAKRFREDLFYRLNVFPVRLPPLRERLELLPAACRILLAQQSARTGRTGMRLSADALKKLERYAWPGNLRELANVLERATILAPGKVIGPEQIELGAGAPFDDGDGGEDVSLEAVERRHILRVLDSTNGRIYGDGGAAELLGLKPSTLQSRMKKLGIRRG